MTESQPNIPFFLVLDLPSGLFPLVILAWHYVSLLRPFCRMLEKVLKMHEIMVGGCLVNRQDRGLNSVLQTC
jgi:hypothetical protein